MDTKSGSFMLRNFAMHIDKAFLLVHVCHLNGLDLTMLSTARGFSASSKYPPAPTLTMLADGIKSTFFLIAMHVLLAPIPATNAVHAKWSEEDAVALFEQFPHPQMFTLMFQHGRADGEGATLVSWGFR